MPGKIDALLNEKLGKVKWGEFRLGDLFEVNSSKKRFDANKVQVLDKGNFPYVVRMSSNNGQKGFIIEDEKFLNEGNTISFGQDTATMFYQEKPYFTGDKIKILKSKDEKFNKKNAQFFILAMSKAFSSFSWGASSFNSKIICSQIIQLPIKNSEIHYEFMESFIAVLEAEKIAELDAYLLSTGLKNYTLTAEEEKILVDFENGKVEFGEFTFKNIFNKIVQGRRLKKDDQIVGKIPFVMAGTTNTGVVNYISNPVASFPKNSITIDIFGNTFYRNYDFGASDDIGVYWNDKRKYSKESMLFFTVSMAKSVLGKFSYGKKLRSSQSFNFKMKLPTLIKQKPDYKKMGTIISAIQKLVIKDVVVNAERKISVYKQMVNKNTLEEV